MIIDFHAHIFSPKLDSNRESYLSSDPVFAELYSDPRAKLASVDALISSMDVYQIGVSVIQNLSWKSYDLCQETNDYIMESISRFPDRIIGFCMIPFDSPELALKEIDRCAKNGIKGVGEIRLQPDSIKHNTTLKQIIQSIIQHDLILSIHSSEPVGHLYPGKGNITPDLLYSLASQFPDLKLVCAHWGGGLPFYSLMPEVSNVLKNVYFDTAASPYLYKPDIYPRVIDLVGVERILFGSDYPLLKPLRLIDEINNCNLTQNQIDSITFSNAARLLGIL